jgi:hypothetical protein
MRYYSFRLVVPWIDDEVVQRLGRSTRRPGLKAALQDSMLPLEGPISPFVGEVDSSSFRLRRNIRYRNSLLPKVRGCVVPTAAGTEVRVTMVAPVVVLGFLLICGCAFTQLVAGREDASGTDVLIAGVVLSTAIASLIGGLAIEARKTRRLLERVFDGEAGNQ